MKLRNKKTGEIVERSSIVTLRYKISSSSSSLVEAEEFGSIEQLNEEWEDYKPAEPLIKDPKIRKAVRAWAEVNNLTQVFCNIPHLIEGNMGKARMRFEKAVFENLQMGKDYAIEELCGEEEEIGRSKK